MINILFPANGSSMFFKDYYFPKLVMEVKGETVLEKVVKNYSSLKNKHFIFVLNKSDCSEFHLDKSAKLITGEECCSVITLKNTTGGALCTCLLAIEKINNDSPLIISNCDQIIDADICKVVEFFEKNNFDAGVITFRNIHPRWSYAKFDNNIVVEVAEKRPISQKAIAGFYYYKKGSDFVKAAMQAIFKESSLNGIFYISSSLNEMILLNKKIGAYEINKSQYHSFYSPEKIREYERSVEGS